MGKQGVVIANSYIYEEPNNEPRNRGKVTVDETVDGNDGISLNLGTDDFFLH